MKTPTVVVLSCMLIAACQQFGDFRNEEPPPTGPGKKLVVLPAEVWKQENCETRKLPYLRLDDTGITPQTVKPGESINYRFSYTACVPKQPGYILGRFQTEIFYKGKKLSTRYDDGYPVETGKLIVDTDIAVPRIVMPGSYTLKAKLSVEDATLYDSAEFTVVP